MNINEPQRYKLPTTRASITHKFCIAGEAEEFKGFIIVGMYPDGSPGEVFLVVQKGSSSIRGMAKAWGTSFAYNLQYGVPLSKVIGKFSHWRFQPAGMTGNPDIPIAKSVVDYVARWLDLTFTNKRPEHFMLSDTTHEHQNRKDNIMHEPEYYTLTKDRTSMVCHCKGGPDAIMIEGNMTPDQKAIHAKLKESPNGLKIPVTKPEAPKTEPTPGAPAAAAEATADADAVMQEALKIKEEAEAEKEAAALAIEEAQKTMDKLVEETNAIKAEAEKAKAEAEEISAVAKSAIEQAAKVEKEAIEMLAECQEKDTTTSDATTETGPEPETAQRQNPAKPAETPDSKPKGKGKGKSK